MVVKKVGGYSGLYADLFTRFNAQLETHWHPLSTWENLFSRLNRGKIFLRIDLSYFQFEVDEFSKKLVTTSTH